MSHLKAVDIAWNRHTHAKGKDLFEAQYSGTTHYTCKHGNNAQSHLLLTTARHLTSQCFEFSVVEITLSLKGDGEKLCWRTSVLVENILSKSSSMLAYFPSGNG